MTVAEQAAEGTTQKAVHTRALIIGTGFSGLGMGIALKKQGVDFLILEKADDVGGTWRDNTYPGRGVRCAVAPVFVLLRAETRLAACLLVSARHSRLSQGRHRQIRPEAATFASASMSTARTGMTPSIAGTYSPRPARSMSPSSSSRVRARCTFRHCPISLGSATFDGPVFHTAQWDHSVDLTGKRVAVIGTGASAIQVVPELVKIAGQVQLYQRTPAWIKPRINFAFPRRR